MESAKASLAALVAHLASRGVFDELRAGVHIAQKTVKDSPQDKVQDILLALLCGCQSLVQINTRRVQEDGLQRAAGRTRVTEQSVAKPPLDAATSQNVDEVQQVLTRLLHREGQVAHHPFRSQWLMLDADLTGLPTGKRAQESKKGYFSNPKQRRGRQQARVLASQYGEIVVDALYPGNTLLVSVLPDLVQQAEQVLGLKPSQRRRTIYRIDGGGGSIGSVNGLISQDYAVATKDYSFRRTALLAKRVKEWVADSTQPNREMSWVTAESSDYVGPVKRLAVRSKSRKGRWQYAVLLFAHLSDFDVLTLVGERPTTDAATIMRAYLHFYDQRGGGIESSFGQDKSGLGLTKRHKKRLVAQRFLMLLGTLAHNLLTFARRWLAQASPEAARQLQPYGIKRLIRDLGQINGVLSFDAHGRLCAIVLNSACSLAKLMLLPLRHLLAPASIVVTLDKT
jgi:hypothetical protein